MKNKIKNSTISRAYPIRRTAKAWKIPIISIHSCNIHCSYIFKKEPSPDGGWYYLPVENPEYVNGKCPKYGMYQSSILSFVNFNPDDPRVGDFPILGPDEVVICDTRFDVIIQYPLRGPVKTSMFAPSEKGFTRVELIDSLKNLYEYIYREEERTATPTVYEYRIDCQLCINQNITSYLTDCTLTEKCTICYTSIKTQACSLPCGHFFHRECILPWAQEQNTCPLCRSYIKKCSECNGLGFISQHRENVVIPIEDRGFFLNRNTTDGIFGIWGYDLEDLVLEQMFYDREHRLLRISVGS